MKILHLLSLKAFAPLIHEITDNSVKSTLYTSTVQRCNKLLNYRWNCNQLPNFRRIKQFFVNISLWFNLRASDMSDKCNFYVIKPKFSKKISKLLQERCNRLVRDFQNVSQIGKKKFCDFCPPKVLLLGWIFCIFSNLGCVIRVKIKGWKSFWPADE